MIDEKICTYCKESLPATPDFFFKGGDKIDGLTYWCKTCCKAYRLKNKESLSTQRKTYQSKNKEKLADKKREYYKKNKDKSNKQSKEYRKNNKDKLSKWHKENYKKNKEKKDGQMKKYYKQNKEKILKQVSEYSQSRVKTSSVTTIKELSLYEDIRETENGKYIEIKCTYCGKWVNPTHNQSQHRIQNAKGNGRGECRIYCNDNNGACKLACPTYGQILYPKGFKKATSREVNPLIRQMCFLRDNYECQKCGASIKDTQLHCHHIEGYAQNKMIGNDITNVVTLCKSCHKAIHKKPGCGYHELREETFECA